MQKMDLTTGYPASVREKLHGVVQLRRAIDKGIAKSQGTEGEYNFDCPMDKGIFEFLAIDGNALYEKIKSANDFSEIEAYVKPFVEKKSAAELEAFNADWLNDAPAAGSDGEKYLRGMVDAIDPKRTDITTWADMLDFDEKRPVPVKAAV